MLFSVLLTAFSLLGFGISNSFIFLCLCAIPYGLGAGSVDAALNNYVALHFESKHMSWLHCMWGIGATLGPYIMGFALTNNLNFHDAYKILFIIQILVSFILFITLPVWKKKELPKDFFGEIDFEDKKVLSLREVINISGVPYILITFFCFCAIEHTAGLWASSYLVLNRGLEIEIAASFGALFYLGITVGRALSGFIAIKFNDIQMIRAGELIMFIGLIILLLPLGADTAFFALMLIGFGSAPVYPCIIHSTPLNFGVKNSQAITGVQMASAYTGTLIIPALFGLIAQFLTIDLYPLFLGILLIIMIIMYELLLKKLSNN